MRISLAGVGVDRVALARQKGADRAPQRQIRDPVGRPGQRRLEAARDLVLALRARLEVA